MGGGARAPRVREASVREALPSLEVGKQELGRRKYESERVERGARKVRSKERRGAEE